MIQNEEIGIETIESKTSKLVIENGNYEMMMNMVF